MSDLESETNYTNRQIMMLADDLSRLMWLCDRRGEALRALVDAGNKLIRSETIPDQLATEFAIALGTARALMAP